MNQEQEKVGEVDVSTALATTPDTATYKANTIYLFEVKRLGTDRVYKYTQLHGRCVPASISELGSFGYNLVQTGLIEKDDYYLSRTVCSHCGKQSNPTLAKKLITENAARLQKRKTDWATEVKRKLDTEKEMILLGKL